VACSTILSSCAAEASPPASEAKAAATITMQSGSLRCCDMATSPSSDEPRRLQWRSPREGEHETRQKSGASIAVAIATLVLTIGAPAAPSHADDARGAAIGANACKGQSACSTNGCSGTNACKGQGYLELTKAECETIPSTKFEPEKPD
jgi:hypothetical protein